MGDLQATIRELAAFFKTQASERYVPDGKGGFTLAPDSYWDGQEWESPQAALEKSLSRQHLPYALRNLKGQPGTIAKIAAWLAAHKIDKLCWLGGGNSAAVFEARNSSNPSKLTVLRLGEKAVMPFHLRRWNRPHVPLMLQPEQAAFIEQGEMDSFNLELLPHLDMGIENHLPQGFIDLINNHVLKGTPFALSQDMWPKAEDLTILPDGTPVFIDPDKLNFRDDDLAKKHVRDQFDPAWQNKIRGIIHRNCENLNLPEPLRWVVEKSPGIYVSKQEILYPSAARPVPIAPQPFLAPASQP